MGRSRFDSYRWRVMGKRRRQERKWHAKNIMRFPPKIRGRRMMHESYHIEGVTDLSVIRRQAEDRSKDRRHPEGTVIHLHDKSEPCDLYKHETVEIDGART